MTSESTAPKTPQQPDDADMPKSDDMRRADTANGENPAADETSPETGPGATNPHPTGERQARENAENDPPA